MIFIFLIIYFILVVVIASSKNRNPFLWFLLSFFPLCSLVLLFLPKVDTEESEIAKKQLELQQMQMEMNINKDKQAQQETIECPNCAETIKEKAKICRFCNNEVVNNV